MKSERIKILSEMCEALNNYRIENNTEDELEDKMRELSKALYDEYWE